MSDIQLPTDMSSLNTDSISQRSYEAAWGKMSYMLCAVDQDLSVCLSCVAMSLTAMKIFRLVPGALTSV